MSALGTKLKARLVVPQVEPFLAVSALVHRGPRTASAVPAAGFTHLLQGGNRGVNGGEVVLGTLSQALSLEKGGGSCTGPAIGAVGTFHASRPTSFADSVLLKGRGRAI